ncbi:MAG: FGGY-family carbohydrate kinase [Paracoccaceae bacterium]|nr:FGGY-family carbohydrate kinase [Paracoccaceae bacterium]
MINPRHIAVIDIGKTNAKLALVDLVTLAEIDVVTRPNIVLPGPPWPHFDTEGHWQFLLDALAAFHRTHGVDAISITTHGACAALLATDGSLAAPVLDYEHNGPDTVAAQYDALRPGFDETGSPRLAHGLNLGAQLHWQFWVDPGLKPRVAQVVTWPQYWAHRLTGVVASDVTSLGCHTDLWNPAKGAFSSLVSRLGLEGRMAPPMRSDSVLGAILPAVAEETGLGPATPVVCGIHDSNASLLPHLLLQTAPFAVVSTGTWVVVMAVGGKAIPLDPRRDTLINVNALGDPVPSARFMGGREYEVIRAGRDLTASAADLAAVLAAEVMLLPAVESASGPFPGRKMRWHPEEAHDAGWRGAALAFYLALMTAECLAITGAAGPVIVEGPFAANEGYLWMLAAATGLPVRRARSRTGTSIGAALLFDRGEGEAGGTDRIKAPAPLAAPLAAYAKAWQAAARSGFS